MLQDLGMPIETGRGRAGGYRLKANYRLPPIIFSADEVLALALGVLFARQLGGAGIVKGAETAIAKLERVMPATLREHVQVMDQTLTLRLPTPQIALPSDIINTLSLARYRRQRVSITYRAADGAETTRAVDPYGLVHTIGLWYLVGYCHLRQALRTFRLDRIAAVNVCPETFTPPDKFDALAHVEASIAHTPWGPPAEVLLRTTMAEAQRLVDPVGAILEPHSEGVLLRCYVNDFAQFAHFLAGLPCPLSVRSPVELRDSLAALAAHVARLARLQPPDSSTT
jgi:predicted DNA-binding transcriptional regulator YafY